MKKSYASLASLLAVAAMGATAGLNASSNSAAQITPGAHQTSVSGDTKSTGTTVPSTSRMAALLDRLTKSSRKGPSYPNGPGWGIRQVQRMARKKQNVKANRKNQRG